MLELKNIFKSYITNQNKYEVLKDISISFRKSEFVSILGPSGSGKTTLLNVIGGLDIYDNGDLLINGVSTKEYTDKDWDNYRSNKIGFIFQNYNLIDHLTVLENVKLSLNFSGFENNEVDGKCIEVLKNVGLGDFINKKPNQLSGGQAQRVAIARALVNDPDIIVADEPTGALDSITTIEIMNLLKNISKNKLVIIVTHNTIIAKKYSTRMIKIEDGKIISDSNPCYDQILNECEKVKNNKSLAFKTNFLLSFRNLLTKKKRTVLTSSACSVGIIGIALILSLSNGLNKYIKKIERESISDYPIVIERNTYDAYGMINVPKIKCKKNMICVSKESDSSVIKNNIKDFLNYLNNYGDFKKYINSINYSYDINLNVYNNEYKMINKELFKNININDYSILYGRAPNKYNEIVIIVDKNNYISKDIINYLNLNVNENNFTYNELINNRFNLILNTDYYQKQNGLYVDYSQNADYIKSLVDRGCALKIVGIVKASDFEKSGFGYIDALNKYLIDNISKTEFYHDQVNNNKTNLVTNIDFDEYENTYENIEKELGVYDINNPSRISIYPKNYKFKETIIEFINAYNKKQININKIKYTDLMKSIVDSLSKIINIVSYILIFFTGISLVVSSIMISIITYISVLERTKEIGILRALGASKKDIKKLFNIETIIEGLLSFVFAIIVTIIISLLIDIIVFHIIGIKNISILSFQNMIVLLIVSCVINLLSGLKSSIKASNMNPVDALRYE